MNVDSYFAIGHDHRVCEDYALAEVKANLAYAIVCDGCSASTDVDFGARALALAARETLLQLNPHSTYPAEKFGADTIMSANKIFNTFPHLHRNALDATLLITWVRNETATVIMFGDGVFVHRYKDDKGNEHFNAVHINLSSGAPDYLSYQLDENRLKSYKNLKDNVKTVTRIDVDGESLSENTPLDGVVFEIEVYDGDILSVMSDGMGSFHRQDNTAINWVDMIPEFTGFKSTNGEFVQRRMNALTRKCKKEFMTHGDDISIASIIV
jgi:hypothetical protein